MLYSSLIIHFPYLPLIISTYLLPQKRQETVRLTAEKMSVQSFIFVNKHMYFVASQFFTEASCCASTIQSVFTLHLFCQNTAPLPLQSGMFAPSLNLASASRNSTAACWNVRMTLTDTLAQNIPGRCSYLELCRFIKSVIRAQM